LSTSRPVRSILATAAGLVAVTAVIGADAARTEETLETVEIVSQRQPFRGDIPLQELPQSVQVLSAEILQDVGATKLDNVLDLASGVARQNTFGGLWDSFAIRGFAGDENTPSGYLINGFNAGRGFSGRRDASNIASIEVLKGPGSALYGRAEPGGTINIVTRKPSFESEGSVELTGGSFGTKRIAADYTGPLSGNVAFRINGAYEDNDSFRDFFTSKRATLTPSVIARLGPSTTLSYELEWTQQEAPFERGVVATAEGVLGVIPESRFLGEPGDGVTKVKALGHQQVLQHDFSDRWSLLAGAGYRDSSFKGFSSDPELAAGRQPYYSGTTRNVLLGRQRRYRDFSAKDLSARAELSGRIETGAITHHVLTGVDYYDYELEQLQNRIRFTLAGTYAINIFNPAYGQTAIPTAFLNNLENQKATGIYVQDQMDLTEQWKLLVGVRYDTFDQELRDLRGLTALQSQSKTATSPRAGLVFEATPNISVYTSFSKGFRPNSGADALNNAFKPEKSESAELGLKVQSDDGELTGTVAIYTAEKSNFLTADPANANFSIAAGEAKSRGLEVDIAGQLSDDLTLSASYAYTDAFVSKPAADFNFGNPLPAGAPLINIPKHSGTLLLMRDVRLADATWSYGGSLNYVGQRLGETGVPAALPIFNLPSYTLLNLMGGYAPNDNLKFTLNVTNVTDKEYFPSSYARIWVAPGQPRAFTLRAAYSFK
jgi:iron complex outermembrane receptor protein